ESTRDQARFADALPLSELIEGASLLLSEKGHFDLIIPFSEEQKALEIATSYSLLPNRITRVKGTGTSPVKRSLISFGFENAAPEIDELILEISRHNYTEEFKNLVKDFYLKL
ncbi:MAG: tRNA (adenine-N(6)-)-methyltransferase, partial [Christiangramia sp.]|nr:tRNA (adenine-N(6)-)-methyltransferase [Christiangramia sp.]